MVALLLWLSFAAMESGEAVWAFGYGVIAGLWFAIAFSVPGKLVQTFIRSKRREQRQYKQRIARLETELDGYRQVDD